MIPDGLTGISISRRLFDGSMQDVSCLFLAIELQLGGSCHEGRRGCHGTSRKSYPAAA